VHTSAKAINPLKFLLLNKRQEKHSQVGLGHTLQYRCCGAWINSVEYSAPT